jgi:hypothetical protein
MVFVSNLVLFSYSPADGVAKLIASPASGIYNRADIRPYIIPRTTNLFHEPLINGSNGSSFGFLPIQSITHTFMRGVISTRMLFVIAFPVVTRSFE